jgi:hypothetical protein
VIESGFPIPTGLVLVRVSSALGFGQARGQDPHELRRRLRPHPGPRVRQVVLQGRVRQAEAMGGCLLRPGDEDRGDHPDLTVSGALGGAYEPGDGEGAGPKVHALLGGKFALSATSPSGWRSTFVEHASRGVPVTAPSRVANDAVIE